MQRVWQQTHLKKEVRWQKFYQGRKMAKGWKDRLIELLRQKQLLSERDLEKGIKLHKERGGSLGKILLDEGFISQKDLMVTLSKELNLPPINLSRYKIDAEVLKLIPLNLARKYSLIPISKIGNVLMVAMSDPMNILAIDELETLTAYKVEPVISTEEQILKALDKYYEPYAEELTKVLEQVKEIEEKAPLELVREEKIDLAKVEEESKAAPIVRIVDLIISEALRKRASDIHIEPEEDCLRIRYRVDGDLHEVHTLPKKNQNAVLARLKIMSGLDITESRLPQDGRFKVEFEGRQIDFRVSVLPVGFGGKIVLRALDKSSLSIGLQKLGFASEALKEFKKAIIKPYGMILVTGPTGSGKSTTLYSILNQFNIPEKNIVTIEDPVEYQIEGITQVWVKPEIGLSFANGLRSILRQSPDIIMVGEIRDFETADIAIKASLTGQLLLSTLHTNDAPSAITRLVDMGVEPFLVAASLVGVCAQRLCRKICPHCRQEYIIPKDVLKRVGLLPEKTTKDGDGIFFKGKGCQHCLKTGYYGRTAIIEFLTIDENIKTMIVAKYSSDQIKEYAVKTGMKTLKDDGFDKVKQGITTLEEILRVAGE